MAAYLAMFAVSLFGAVFLFCIGKNARKYMKTLVVLSYAYAFALATFGYCITLLDYSRGTINFVTFTVLFMIIPVFCTLDPITYEGMLFSYTIHFPKEFLFFRSGFSILISARNGARKRKMNDVISIF